MMYFRRGDAIVLENHWVHRYNTESEEIMEKKKALLVVAGGRPIPDVLALYAVQPHGIVILTSEQGWDSEQTFVEIAKSLPNYEYLSIVPDVKAYNFDSAKDSCIQAWRSLPETEWNWVYSISSGPKITGIAAYEVAKEEDIPCLYIDTRQEKIVSLVKDFTAVIGDTGISLQELFHMSVSDYMKIQRREHKPLKPETAYYRKMVEHWIDLAHLLAFSPETPSFIKMMHDKKENILVPFVQPRLAASSLVRKLEELGAVVVQRDSNRSLTCAFTTKHFARFIGTGDWLEVYVWQEAKATGIADDCHWGYEISSAASSELDVVLTYKAQLIFAECKADEDPFKGNTSYLDTINNKAEMLGRTYVTKLFITNASKMRPGYANFLEQAKLRKIVVVTAEDFPTMGEIIRKQAINPDYSRI